MAFNVRIMPVKVIDEVWDFVFGSPNVGTDDVVARGIRYAADNGAEGDQHEHRPHRRAARRRSSTRPSVTPSSRGAFVAVAAGNTADVGQRAEPDRGIRAEHRRHGRRRRGRPQRWSARTTRPPTAYVEIAAPGGDFSARRRDRRHPAADARSGSAAHLRARPAALFGAPRADVVRLLLLPGHVDGHAARRGARGAADAAGHHQPGRRSKRR